MTQPTILCFHRDCEASSRLFNNFKATKMGGEHQTHDCDEVIDLQAMLKESDFNISQMKNLKTVDVDEFCQNVKKEFVQLIDQYATNQKKYITQQELEPSSIEFTKCMLLIKAILENELQVLEDNQKFFLTLRKIDQIRKDERIQTEKVDLEVTDQNNLLSQRIKQCFKFSLQQDVPEEVNKIKDLEQKLIKAEERSTQNLQAQKEQVCQLAAIKNSLKAAEQKYAQIEVKYNVQTKDVKILQDLLKAQQNEMDLIKQELQSMQKFSWSSTNKHTSVRLEGKQAKCQAHGHNNAVLLEPRLSIQQSHSVMLKMVVMGNFFVHICDLKTIKTKCSNFQDIYQIGFGAYSHFYNGTIYATDTYGQGTTPCFSIAQGDIIELMWDGPLKKFTTHKLNTGEKYIHYSQTKRFVLDVTYDANAEIYFGVSINGVNSIEIM